MASVTLSADLSTLDGDQLEIAVGELALSLSVGDDVLLRDGSTELTGVVEQLDSDSGRVLVTVH